MSYEFVVTRAREFLGHSGVDVWISSALASGARMTIWVDRSGKTTITGGVAFPEESTIDGIEKKAAWLALVAKIARSLSDGGRIDDHVTHVVGQGLDVMPV